ncbi:MAB_1171c family putative transporter [Streptomyces sp. NPDC029216]|uniref:MAB_1171c family putative transporter n=1 Tax=Streptomyces sp. NPDC029216 TaxID=3154701 RepID=UPI0033F5119A
MPDPTVLLPTALGGVAALLRLPGLLRNPRDPLLRAVMAMLVTGVGVFFFTSVPMVAKINALTGVPNAAAPFGYVWVMVNAASGIALLINWRGGSPEGIRRATRWCTGTYGALSIALVVLFALGEAPVERLRDLDTYYAGTPYLREMIVLYLVGHTAASVVMASLCLRWMRHVEGELRAGLALMVTGYLLAICFGLLKFTAVGARWAGTDWDVLSTEVARALISAAAPFITFGMVFPIVVGRFRGRWRDWIRYRRLGPLSRLVGGLAPASAAAGVPLLASVGVRRLQRESVIHDGLLALNPYFDLGLRARTLAEAVAGGATADHAAADADAAMVVAAVETMRADPERRVIASSRTLQEPAAGAERDLVRISQALGHTSKRAAADGPGTEGAAR